MPMDFDPNEEPKNRPEWATYVPTRYDHKFKMHRRRQDAFAAYFGHRNFIMYQWDKTANRWNEVYRLEDRKLPQRGELCDRCGTPFQTDEEYAAWRGHSYAGYNKNHVRAFEHWEKAGNRLKFPPNLLRLCSICHWNY